MTEQQIPQLAGALVIHQRNFGALPNDDAQWAIQNTAAAIALFADAVKNRANAAVKKLLEFVGIIATIAVARFVTAEKFREGETVDDVSITWLGPNFNTNFGGLVETNVAAAELKVNRLLQPVRDLPEDDEPGIITELVGRHKTKLAQFHQILAHKQRTRDFTWIIAYICDKNGILWAVDAIWNADYGGWYVGASSVENPDGWIAGNQVLSR